MDKFPVNRGVSGAHLLIGRTVGLYYMIVIVAKETIYLT